MHHATPLITTIVGGLVLAFILGMIANKLRISPLVGYLLAGVLAGPFTPGFVADTKLAPELAELGVIVVPDVICNAGGVTVSYFEWVQDMASFFWSEEEINAKMDRIMTDAIVHVWDKAAEKECTLRTAAYIVACERILMARKDRGIYPG